MTTTTNNNTSTKLYFCITFYLSTAENAFHKMDKLKKKKLCK